LHDQTQPPHPKEVFQKKLLGNGRLNQSDLATALGMSTARVSMIISGRCRVSAEVALRVERVFGIPAQFWLKLCGEYELHRERHRLVSELAALPHLGALT
jgi:addiction module HigA family antidote